LITGGDAVTVAGDEVRDGSTGAVWVGAGVGIGSVVGAGSVGASVGIGSAAATGAGCVEMPASATTVARPMASRRFVEAKMLLSARTRR
jgi:hypothetical protein